jgi:hypothetical protein
MVLSGWRVRRVRCWAFGGSGRRLLKCGWSEVDRREGGRGVEDGMGHFKVIVYVTRLLLLNTLIICTMLPFETNALRLPQSRYLIVLYVLSYAVRHVHVAHMIFHFMSPTTNRRVQHPSSSTCASKLQRIIYLSPLTLLLAHPICWRTNPRSPHTRAYANAMDPQDHRTGEDTTYLPPPYPSGKTNKLEPKSFDTTLYKLSI